MNGTGYSARIFDDSETDTQLLYNGKVLQSFRPDFPLSEIAWRVVRILDLLTDRKNLVIELVAEEDADLYIFWTKERKSFYTRERKS